LQAVKRWKQNNPEEVAKHYEDYVKPWREARRAERLRQQQSLPFKGAEPPLQECLELVLRIPAEKRDVIRDEIRLRRVDNTTFAAYGP
jgi:hypothetical protein